MGAKKITQSTLVVRGWTGATRHGVDKRLGPNKFLTFCGRVIEGTTIAYRHSNGTDLCANCVRVSDRAVETERLLASEKVLK